MALLGKRKRAGFLAFPPYVSHTAGRDDTPFADHEASCAIGCQPVPDPSYPPGRCGLRVARCCLCRLFCCLSGRVRSSGGSSILLGLGSLFQFLACGLSFCSRKGWREPVGPAVIMLYVIGLSWMLVAAVGLDDWYLHTCQAVLLVVPLGFFALQCLRRLGAPTCAAPVSLPINFLGAWTGRPIWTLAVCCRK